MLAQIKSTLTPYEKIKSKDMIISNVLNNKAKQHLFVELFFLYCK